jgi:hypothetical protein
MTIPATDCAMRTKQREPGLLMHGCHITDDPCFWRMASFAIFTQRFIVDICVAFHTTPSFIPECQRFMTILAIHYRMLSCQFKIGVVVIKLNCTRFYFPVFGCMTLRTIDMEIFPMRRYLSFYMTGNQKDDYCK